MLDEILYSGKIAEWSRLCILWCLQLRQGRDGFDEDSAINFVIQSFFKVSRGKGVSATSVFAKLHPSDLFPKWPSQNKGRGRCVWSFRRE